jgi:lipopolysaccharide heptosyltransferase II
VLIVKLAAIGDVVMALPMVSALRAQDVATQITWLCGSTAAPLVERVEGIDECVVVDDVAVLSGNRAQKAQAVMNGWSTLRGRRFDLVITAHSDPRYRMLGARVRAAERRWLGERGGRTRLVPGRYYGDEYVRLVTGIDDERAIRFPPPRVRVTLDSEVAKRIAAFAGRRLIALAPGGARNPARDNPLRRWPLTNYAALARQLVASGDVVLLTGTVDDEWIRAAFVDIDVTDLSGVTTLPGLAALYERCAAVVTHDSGPLHIARLVDARVVGLFGPTMPATILRDSPRTIALWPGVALPCAPCYDGQNYAACPSNRCLQLLAPEVVAASVTTLVGR